jgi:hypothetical protein
MLSQVIEHIYHPGPFLDELVQALRPGGVVIVMTPDTRSYSAMVTGKYWAMLRPVDHVTLIGRDTFPFFKFSIPVEVTHDCDEFAFDFGGSVLSAAKSIVTGRELAVSSRPGPLGEYSRRGSALRAALSALTFPVHVVARMTGRQGCLVSTIRRLEAPGRLNPSDPVSPIPPD